MTLQLGDRLLKESKNAAYIDHGYVFFICDLKKFGVTSKSNDIYININEIGFHFFQRLRMTYIRSIDLYVAVIDRLYFCNEVIEFKFRLNEIWLEPTLLNFDKKVLTKNNYNSFNFKINNY